MTEKTRFRPVVGTESKILGADIQPGFLYLASDTGKIFFDYDYDTRMIMGGSGSSIFYAADSNVVDTGYEGIYELHISSLENTTTLPKENDIIINTDNCFYRVTSIQESDSILEATRIAIAGSGSSSGGSGTSSGTASVKYVTNSNISVLYGGSCPISFEVIAKDAADEFTVGGKVTWKLDNVVIESNVSVKNDINTFDVGSYLKNTDKTQRLTGVFSLVVGTDINATVIKSWDISAINVAITWNYDTAEDIVDEEDFIMEWKVTGNTSVSRMAHIIIDDTSEITQEVSSVTSQTITLNRDENQLTHGVHNISLYVSFEINGETFKTSEISYDIIFVSADNNEPIIAVGEYESTIQQYDTLNLPIYLYNASSVELSVDGDIVDTWSNLSTTGVLTKYWSYTPSTAGLKKLIISSGTVEKIINLTVESLNLSVEEKGNYAFKIKASDFPSSEALKKWESDEFTISDGTVGGSKVTASLEFSDNFDWINGGIQREEDDNGNTRQYICIKSGTYMTIKYPLFASTTEKGKNIKIIFKVTNCGNYDAEVISCKQDDDDVYLSLKAQSVMFSYSGGGKERQYCEDTYIEYETDITKKPTTSNPFAYVMPWFQGIPAGVETFDSTASFQQALKSGAEHLPYITVGSEDCDVYLYLFKVYEQHLDSDDHLSNFIMDALNSQEILERYNRNDILSDDYTNEISWEKLIEKNPDCWVHLYTMPRMTKKKADEIGKNYLSSDEAQKKTDFQLIGLKADRYRPETFYTKDSNGNFILATEKSFDSSAEYYRLDSPKYYALYKDGDYTTPVIEAGLDVDLPFSYKVQGTSSEGYVISAANLDTKFKKGFRIPDSSSEDGYGYSKKFQLENGAIGESYFNTKVNVASCENANNALNADWYNTYQPYVCAAKAKNEKVRDTMNFKPGIVFIKDENPFYGSSDVKDGFALEDGKLDYNIFAGDDVYRDSDSLFFKQYAICNFGNSKKNIDTLHDPENYSEICVEVTDNQNIGQHMCAVTGTKNITETEKEYYDLTNKEISYDYETNQGNDVYELFRTTMEDGDYDVRYTSAALDDGNDGIENASPQQIIGFFKLVQWFAKNDPCQGYVMNGSERTTSATHPYGYSDLPFTDDQLNQTFADGVTVDFENRTITFDKYTFKKTISFNTGKKGEDEDTYSYSSKLGGFVVSSYANTYTTDCYEYRMAKLLSECEDHLIMDSIVYHYLFIEKHLMVDNVAKNTFWDSEDVDNQYWNLVKDYDNDTADGINNDGELKFTYGIEPDAIQDDGTTPYFNADTSVWFNFLHGLYSVRKKLYGILNDAGAWNVSTYLNKFNSWQKVIPERCWIEDYYRKYIRPYEIYGDNTYLKRLEGGLKTFQRKQFETYQNIYLNTKYQTSPKANAMYIRANAVNVSEISIPVTMYSDCYIYQEWAQNIIHKRVSKGEVVNITCPGTISSATDATLYWYAPETYSTIGDIGQLYPKSINLNNAIRLQSLIMTGESLSSEIIEASNATESTYNYTYVDDSEATVTQAVSVLIDVVVSDSSKLKVNNVIKYNNQYYRITNIYEDSEQNKYYAYLLIDEEATEKASLASFDGSTPGINSATLLKKLVLKDLTAINSGNGATLNLSAFKSLKEVDIRNSNFVTLALPEGAPLISVKVENPKNIVAKDLYFLKEFFINEIQNGLKLSLDNIDNNEVNTLDTFILPAMNEEKSLSYWIQNVKWNVEEYNEGMFEDDNISFLNYLLGSNCYPLNANGDFINSSTQRFKDSLSGELIIGEEAYGKNADETHALEIYSKYIDENAFPNLDINFENESCTLFKVSIVNANNQVVWERKYQNSTRIDNDFLENGSAKFSSVLESIKSSKSSSINYIYTFNNTWTLIIDGQENGELIKSESPLYNEEISGNIIIKPNFDATVREYIVNYHFGDNLKTINAAYGTQATTLSQSFYPYLDDSQLDDKKTYRLKGWSLYKDGSILQDYSTRSIKGDIDFYAIFEEVSVYQNPLDSCYCDWEENSDYAILLNVKSGINLYGKITIPAKYNDKNVLEIGSNGNAADDIAGFKSQYNITEIYFEEGTKCTTIATNCFYNGGDSNCVLSYIEFPSTITSLGKSCVGGNPYLKLPDISNLKIETIPYGFYNNSGGSIESENIFTTYAIPNTVKTIEEFAFRPSTFKINTLILGEKDQDLNLEIIESNSFDDSSLPYPRQFTVPVDAIIVWGNSNTLMASLKTLFNITIDDADEAESEIKLALMNAFGYNSTTKKVKDISISFNPE